MRGPRYSEEEARKAVRRSKSWAESLRRLGMCQTGGGAAILKKYCGIWSIPTAHFDPYAHVGQNASPARPLEDVLVEGSTYGRKDVKRRLLAEGIKQPECELCGQGEIWRGRRLALILDHVNGVSNDHRLENLRIACPNCAATLDTHCARTRRQVLEDRECEHCAAVFRPRRSNQRYCSRACGSRWDRGGRGGSRRLRGVPKLEARRVERPPRPQLLREIAALGYCGVARRYGVSDNAIRKWVRQYEREAEAAELG